MPDVNPLTGVSLSAGFPYSLTKNLTAHLAHHPRLLLPLSV